MFIYQQTDVKASLFDSTKEDAKEIVEDIEKIIRNYHNLQITKDGINIAIVGKPNVGKSTLINVLAQKDVSIVSDIPGTTRDTVQVNIYVMQSSIEIGGFKINLIDTAGLRDSDNQI